MLSDADRFKCIDNVLEGIVNTKLKWDIKLINI